MTFIWDGNDLKWEFCFNITFGNRAAHFKGTFLTFHQFVHHFTQVMVSKAFWHKRKEINQFQVVFTLFHFFFFFFLFTLLFPSKLFLKHFVFKHAIWKIIWKERFETQMNSKLQITACCLNYIIHQNDQLNDNCYERLEISNWFFLKENIFRVIGILSYWHSRNI